ncbi:YeiH family protein [Oxalobacter paraformigenes]|uniref:Sulfate exporter family transporter n=1 Tax=Oxalobacter paraformigenes TaxID=556268 RepID=C3X1D8_9BURK|nr:putative sulfate exporter family transporter [Oxalobacter paraformigenes]EEO27024.1 hypothetical protein OFAG_00177 [Oxalobacter paraformigenes]
MDEPVTSKSVTAIHKIVFFILLLVCLTPYISIPLALFMGLAFAILFRNPFPEISKKTSKYLLQVSVVGLGFGMNLFEALKAGKDGIIFTIASVFGVLLLGVLLGKVFKLEKTIAYLISAGTAICGGSAIAAVAPIVKAKDTEISVSIGTVFILNAIALFIFPILGHYFNLSQDQFGTWAAIAIHDVSSVVGASAAYGEEALKIATTVKLTRALWIIPVAIVTSFFFKQKSDKIYKPWFILFFTLAMLANTFLPIPEIITTNILWLAKKGFAITLFLIGTDLSLKVIRTVGVKSILFGVLLWAFISVLSFIVITVL